MSAHVRSSIWELVPIWRPVNNKSLKKEYENIQTADNVSKTIVMIFL